MCEVELAGECVPNSDVFFTVQEKIPMRSKILLVEDNPGDVFLARRALMLHGVEAELTVIGDGQSAISFIDRADAGEIVWRPDLILLDLNLPRATGTQILERLRRSRKLNDVPAVIVTSSDNQKDRDAAALLGATQYFHKPIDLAGSMELGAVVVTLLQNSRAAGAS